jgi:hypothetical protein
MKKYLSLFFLLFILNVSFSQETKSNSVFTFDINYSYGVIANHNPDILHLIKGHPESVLLSLNKKTYGLNDWEERFNFPDLGVSFLYQDFKNPDLGYNYSLYAHYNFYFFKRNVMFRIGQGIAYATNPYDSNSNFRNVAFGSTFLSSTYVMLNYKKERLFNTRFGIQLGVTLNHYSNGNTKVPNTSVNTFSSNLGVSYTFKNEVKNNYIKREKDSALVFDKFRYNIAFRGGLNQGELIGSDQYPFYIASFYVDKQIGSISALQFGSDVFFSDFLKEEIKYNSIAYPERNIDPNTDYKRVGLFFGHELFINRMSLITQLGYYIYYPYEYDIRVYERIGFKRYFGDYVFGSVTLKAHGASAEAIEFGLGFRL